MARKKPAAAATSVLLAAALLLTLLTGAVQPTLAAYSTSTVTLMQGGARNHSQLVALGHSGSFAQTVVDNQTNARLAFTAKYNLTEGYRAKPIYIADHYVLLDDGTVCSDDNARGQAIDPNYRPYPLRVLAGQGTFFNDVKTIDGINYLGNVIDIGVAEPSIGGQQSVIALTSTGHVYTWGATNWGQAGTGVVDASTYYTLPQCVLAGEAGDPNIQSSPNDSQTYNGVKYLSNVKQIHLSSATYVYDGALTRSGAVYTWGSNYLNPLGNGNGTDSYNAATPVRVLAGDSVPYGDPGHYQTVNGINYMYGVDSISIGDEALAMITTNRKLYVTGTNQRYKVPYRVTVSSNVHGEEWGGRRYPAGVKAAVVEAGRIWILINGRLYRPQVSQAPRDGLPWVIAPSYEASLEGDSDTPNNATSPINNIAYIFGQHNSVYVVDNDGKLFTSGTNSDGRQYTGTTAALDGFVRMPAGDAVNHPGHYYLGANDGKPYFKFTQIPTSARNFSQYAFIGYVNGNTVYSRYNYAEWPEGQSAPVTYLMDDTINQVLPLVGMEIYKVKDPSVNGLADASNGNRLKEIAFTANRNLTPDGKATLNAEIKENGNYRAYYSLGGNLQWYIDIRVNDILENAITITPEDNAIETGYDTVHKQAYINLRSDFTATNVPSIAAGRSTSAMVAGDGSVWTWGDEKYGDLGHGVLSGSTATPARVLAGEAALDDSGNYVMYGTTKDLGNIKKIICGDDHMLAIANDGRVYTWGRNDRGQLGNGNTTDQAAPVRVQAGEAFGGLGTEEYYETNPGSLVGSYLCNVKDAGAGSVNSGFICADADATGRLYTCGDNSAGQLGIGETSTTPVSQIKRVKAGQMGIKSPHASSISMENSDTYESIGGTTFPKNITQVDFGNRHMLVLTESSHVYSAGSNSVGQLGAINRAYHPTVATTYAVDVGGSTGDLHYVVSGEAGRTYFSVGKLDLSGLSDIQYRTTRISEVTSIAAHGDSSYAIGRSGCVLGWGGNESSQLGDYTRNNAPAPVFLQFGASVTGTGGGVDYIDMTDAVRPGRIIRILLNTKELCPGGSFLVLRRIDGSVFGVGDNSRGQLGTNTVSWMDEPVYTLQGDFQGSSGTLVIMTGLLASGQDHMLAYANHDIVHRTMLSWGYNDKGQLGYVGSSSSTPSARVNTPVTNIVFQQTTAKYVLTSFVRNFNENPGNGENKLDAYLPTTIDSRRWGNYAAGLATPENPDGWLNHTLNIYENGYYVAKYYIGDNDRVTDSDMSFWTGVVATSRDDLERYNTLCLIKGEGGRMDKRSYNKMMNSRVDLTLPGEELSKLYLIKQLDFIDMARATNAQGEPIKSTLAVDYFVRPVQNNTQTDSLTLPHVGPYNTSRGETVTETLYLYGPKPPRQTGQSDEHYQYYVRGDELLKLTPTQTYVNGSLTANTGLQQMYNGGDNLHRVLRQVLVPQGGTYTAIIERDGKLVDIDTFLMPTVTLHIRQVVVNRTSSIVPLPQNGYMVLDKKNDAGSVAAKLGISCSSGDSETTAYTDYTFGITSVAEDFFTVRPIVPQNYRVCGNIVSYTNGSTNFAAAANGPIEVDYTQNNEAWVTVYIEPTTNEPGNFEWDTRVNNFGVVN